MKPRLKYEDETESRWVGEHDLTSEFSGRLGGGFGPRSQIRVKVRAEKAKRDMMVFLFDFSEGLSECY